MLIWLYIHVFKHMFQTLLDFFRFMLQVFHLDVTKVDLDVAYVAMAIHAYFKSMFRACLDAHVFILIHMC